MRTTFANENKVPFKHLSDDQKLLIITEKQKGNVEYWDDLDWSLACKINIDFDFIYRVTPAKPTPLDIPWKYIYPAFKWAAMDKDGDVWFYSNKPVLGEFYWSRGTFSRSNKSDVFKPISTEGIIWDLSLTKRTD